MIKMPDHERDIDVAALANRFTVIDGFKYREPPRMFLNGPGHGVQIARARMRRKRLPLRKCFSRRLDRGINVRRRSLRDRRDFFSGRRIGRVEELAFDWWAPITANEVTEPALMLVEPDQCVFRILRRRAVLHGEKLFGYAHSAFNLDLCPRWLTMPSDGDNLPSSARWHSVPTAVQCRLEVRWPRSGRGSLASRKFPALPS